MQGVVVALDRPSGAGLLSQWTVQPVAIVLVLLLAVGYLRAHRRLERPWPRVRAVTFAGGLVLLTWTSCGFLQVYRDDLFWVWTTQTLVLWLVVPILLLAGHPLQLARAVNPNGRIDAVLRCRPVRVLGNPLVGPALLPLLSCVLFFGPLPGWTIEQPAIGWLVQLALLSVGAVMVLPLVGLDEEASSLAVGLSLAIGALELVLDALPGVVLRLHSSLVTSWFDVRAVHGWSPGAHHDQSIAGAILWSVAEAIDLPFLALVYRRWLRADARDAARVDAVLEAERAARRALAPPGEPEPPDNVRDEPWWLSDPAMRQRLPRED